MTGQQKHDLFVIWHDKVTVVLPFKSVLTQKSALWTDVQDILRQCLLTFKQTWICEYDDTFIIGHCHLKYANSFWYFDLVFAGEDFHLIFKIWVKIRMMVIFELSLHRIEFIIWRSAIIYQKCLNAISWTI